MTRQPGRPAGARRPSPRLERDRQINRLLLIGGGILLLLVIAIPGFAYYQDVIARGQSTAVRVNDETFSMNEFVDRLAYRERILNAQFAGLNDPQLQQFFAQQRATLPEQVKEEIIEGVLVRQEAAERGISVSDEQVDQTITEEFGAATRNTIPQPAASPSPSASPEATATVDPSAAQTAYQNFLDQTGISDQRFRELVRSDLLRERLDEQLRAGGPQTADQARVRAIVLPTREEAQQVLEQIQGGADFATVAAEKSIDEATKSQGGQYDWIARGTREPDFEEKIFGTTGLVPEVVQGLGGFAVVDVQEIEQNRPLSEEQRETLQNQAFQNWLEQAKAQATIEDNLTPENQLWALRRAERQIQQSSPS